MDFFSGRDDVTIEFRQLLIDSIPFKESDDFFERSRQSVDTVIALGAATPEAMLSLLEDTQLDGEARQQLAAFTAWLAYKSAIQSLIHIATTEEETVALRRSAMVYLSSLGRRKVYTTLKNLALNDPDPEIRIGAISAFTVAPSKRAFNLLTKIIVQDSSSQVRGMATRAIASIPQIDKELTYTLLLSKLTDIGEDTIVRAYAAEGLGYLKDKRAMEIIIRNLSHEAPEIRYMCAFALGLMGYISHLPLLEAMTIDHAIFEGWGTVADGAQEGIAEIMEAQKRLDML